MSTPFLGLIMNFGMSEIYSKYFVYLCRPSHGGKDCKGESYEYRLCNTKVNVQSQLSYCLKESVFIGEAGRDLNKRL